MPSSVLTSQYLRPLVVSLFPIGTWLMIILSIQPGEIREVLYPTSLFTFMQGLRVGFPLCIGFLAIIIIGFKLRRQTPHRTLFFGPIGLMFIYGLVGMLASIFSIDMKTSLYWACAYLSVPLALWAIVLGTDIFGLTNMILKMNWITVIVVTGVLFGFGLIKLDFGDFLLNPTSWLDCGQQTWYVKSSGFIRATGVGRYAAITAILALSCLWQPRWRPLLTVIFIAALLLLLYSGARTSFVGFGVAAPFVILIAGGRKAVVGSIAVIVIVIPIALATDIHQHFYDYCISRSARYTNVPNPISPSPLLPETTKVIGLEESGFVGDRYIWFDKLDLGTPVGKRGSDALVNVDTAVKVQDPISTAQEPLPTAQEPLPTAQEPLPTASETHKNALITTGLFTNRTDVWVQGFNLFGESPIFGYGFHADRLHLKAHAHNSLVHAIVQTGILGTVPFVASLLLSWILLLNLIRKIRSFVEPSKTLIIQTAGILTFLTVRTIPESTGAFFSVDWILLAPLLLFLQVAHTDHTDHYEESPNGFHP